MNPAHLLSARKTVSSPLLNRLGAQVFRTVAAHTVQRLRHVRVDPSVRDIVTALNRDGMCMVRDFLPPLLFERARAEAVSLVAKHDGNARQVGRNTIEKFVLAKIPAEDWQTIAEVYRYGRLRATMEAAEKRSIPSTYGHQAIERLTQGPGDELDDPETALHSDIFFNNHKAWIYLDEVTRPDAPLVYVPGSHRLTASQLRNAYSESCGPNHGSRRIEEAEVRRSGLRVVEALVPANTLVLVNTYGWHCRRPGSDGGQRWALHWSLRHNPFKIW